MHILVVEDERRLARAIGHGLADHGFAVELAYDGDTGLWLAQEQEFDAIVLDLMLPGLSGYEVCKRLRAEGNWTPILILTAKDSDDTEARGLDLGADDFLRKPFSFVVLVARLRALIRRATNAPDGVISIGDLRVDPLRRQCWRGPTELVLTAREQDVLISLARRDGGVVSKQELLSDVWGFDFEGDDNIVEVYVGYLRTKIDRPFARNSLQTVRTLGYRLVDDAGNTAVAIGAL